MTSRPRIHRPLSRADPMKKYLAISFLAATPFFAAAQQRPPVQVQDPVQRTQQAIEKAMAQAEAQQAAHIKAGPKTGLDIKELNQMKERIDSSESEIIVSAEQLDTLMNIVFDYTRQLAKANSYKIVKIRKPETDSTEEAIECLQECLAIQKQIFATAS